MSRKSPSTPRSRVKQALRVVWLRSRERAAALKAANYTCEKCGVKQSVAKGREQKVEVHHVDGIGSWEKIITMIFEELLVDHGRLMVLCPKCHKHIHGKE